MLTRSCITDTKRDTEKRLRKRDGQGISKLVEI